MPKRAKSPGAKITPDHPMADIIADAYRVFAGPTPTDTDVCIGCCMEPEIERDFFTPPIDSLPLAYLNDWYFAAYRGSGISKSIWIYLLPRIFEVLAVGQEPSHTGIEVTLDRFPTGTPSPWTDAQWQVIDRFQRAFLAREIAEGTESLDAVLCMFANGGWPLDDLFAQLRATPDATLVERLSRAWCNGTPYIWLTAFWPKAVEQQVLAHYTSPAMSDRFETIIMSDTTAPDIMEQALVLFDLIETYRSSV